MNTRLRKYVTLSVAVLVALLFTALISGCSLLNSHPGPKKDNVARAAPKPSPRIPNDEPVAQVASQVGPSVVQVNVKAIQQTPFGQQSEQGIGSGVIYRKDGYIITNDHVVQGVSEVNVAFADGSTERGKVVGTDPYTDIAVVKVNRDNLPAAKFLSDKKLLVGQLAVAIGSPSGFQSTVTSGVVSGLDRELPSQITGGAQIPSLTGLIQTDAAISPGNSGGALVDRNGEVIGINVAYLPQTQSGQPVEGIGFAIPANVATSVADQIIATGHATHPYLGVRPLTLTPEIAKQFHISVDSGVIIQVSQGGPADKAGLRTKDVITSIGSTRIEDSSDLISTLRKYQPGDTVKVKIVRNGEQRTFNVTLGNSPR